MALVVKDRVRETTLTSGTGAVTLDGPVQAFQSFAAIGNGNTTYYAIVDALTGDWEVGLGTYTLATTSLSRDTVLASTNSGNLVNFAGNPKDVFVTYPAEKSVHANAADIVAGYTIESPSLTATNGIIVSRGTISQNVTVAAGDNAVSVGPLVVNATVTVDDGAWVII